jgi:uncharacterized protein YjbK
MSQEIEIEFKNLLTYDEFLRLIDDFQVLRKDFVEQTNHYFDTESFHLKDHYSALRVRTRKETFTLTLKQQKDNYILETHQPLTENEFLAIKDGQTIPEGEVTEKIEKLIPFQDIKYLGSLTTMRAELPFKDGLIVLDENHYLGKIDYELEYESADYKEGLQNFMDLLASKMIPKRETENKISRFFQEKSRQNK